jgi:hypothetical protein
MKKMLVKILYIFIILIVLSSCTMNPDVHLELALCGSYAVPGMFCADLKGGTYEITILEISVEEVLVSRARRRRVAMWHFANSRVSSGAIAQCLSC